MFAGQRMNLCQHNTNINNEPVINKRDEHGKSCYRAD